MEETVDIPAFLFFVVLEVTQAALQDAFKTHRHSGLVEDEFHRENTPVLPFLVYGCLPV